jgi:hypothetical protein
MYLMVKAAAGHALAGDRSVFFDVDADRYVAAGADASRVLVSVSEGEAATSADLACLAPFLRAGLLVESQSSAPWPVLTSPPHREWSLSQPDARGNLVDIPRVLWSIESARRRLRGRPLRDLLSRATDVRAVSRRVPRDAAERIINRLLSAFRSSQQVLPSLDQCLPRSLALATLLSRRGIAVQLCFGVALPPFAAHCWVERDGVVLGDSVDVVRNFVPILRV